MDNTPQDAWFYTREGEKIGPVTLAELRVIAAEGQLHPRQDMVWSASMDAWKPAGEIEGLFVRKAPETREAIAPSADPYRSPELDDMADIMLYQFDWPGARRRSYLFAVLLFPILWQFILMYGLPFIIKEFGPELAGVIALSGALVPAVVSIWYGLARLSNLGMSRWWFLGNLVPILNLWIGYRCFACPAGYAYHKKLDGAGIFLAILYWLFILLALLTIALIVASELGAIHDPELHEMIQEMMQQTQNYRPTK